MELTVRMLQEDETREHSLDNRLLPLVVKALLLGFQRETRESVLHQPQRSDADETTLKKMTHWIN